MFRSATDLLIDRHHVNHEFSYRELQLKLRILRDQSNYYIRTKLNRRKWQLQTAAETILIYGTEHEPEIRRQVEAREAAYERELEELESGSESELTPKDLEQDAIYNGNLLPDWRDPQYDELGLREYSQSLRVAYSLPESLHYNDNDPVMWTEHRYGAHRPEPYTDEELNLAPYATHVNYASDLVTDQTSVNQVLSDSEDFDFIEHLYRSQWYWVCDNPVIGCD